MIALAPPWRPKALAVETRRCSFSRIRSTNGQFLFKAEVMPNAGQFQGLPGNGRETREIGDSRRLKGAWCRSLGEGFPVTEGANIPTLERGISVFESARSEVESKNGPRRPVF